MRYSEATTEEIKRAYKQLSVKLRPDKNAHSKEKAEGLFKQIGKAKDGLLEGHMVDGRDSAWRNRAPGPHAHRNTARQATDGLWTEARGQQKQSNDPANNQHILNTPIVGRR